MTINQPAFLGARIDPGVCMALLDTANTLLLAAGPDVPRCHVDCSSSWRGWKPNWSNLAFMVMREMSDRVSDKVSDEGGDEGLVFGALDWTLKRATVPSE